MIDLLVALKESVVHRGAVVLWMGSRNSRILKFRKNPLHIHTYEKKDRILYTMLCPSCCSIFIFSFRLNFESWILMKIISPTF
jgi:hypothetical protein